MRGRAPRISHGPSRSRTVVDRRRRQALAAATDLKRIPGNGTAAALVRGMPVQRSVEDLYTLIHSLQGMANTGAASYDDRVRAMIARVVEFMGRGHDEASAAELRVRVQMMRDQWLADPDLSREVKAEVRQRIDPALVVEKERATAQPVAKVGTAPAQPLGGPFHPGHSPVEPATIPFNPGNRPLSAAAAPATSTAQSSRPGPSPLSAFAAPFVPGPRAQIPAPSLLPPVGSDGFEALHKAGRIRLVPVKWWRSAAFPNHNIEICVMADGRRWAIVHIKWRDRKGPTKENVEMMTFKAANGSSIYGGNIWSGATYAILLDEALLYADTAPATQSADVPIHP